MTMKKYRSLFGWLVFLALLQGARVGIKSLVFHFIAHTLCSDALVSLLFMLATTALLLAAAKRKKNLPPLLPERFSLPYKISAALLALFLLSTPLITRHTSASALLSFCYGAIVTPLFEETIFRGLLWERIKGLFKSEKAAYLISSALFAIWHFGYVDTILWRTSLFSPGADIAHILLMKALTAFLIGLALGLARLKCKNVCAALMLHMLINAIGSS